MRLFILSLIIGLCHTLPTWSQTCGAGQSVTLSNQAQIDAFQSTLPAGCTEYLGDITVTANNPDLMPLSFLTRVEGDFDLRSINLTSVAGLSSLTRVGGILNFFNNNLTQVDGLANLTSVGQSLSLSSNNLTQVDGLANLKSVGGSLRLSINKLTQVDGLANLTSVGLSLLLDNNNLTQVDGLANLTSVGGVFSNFSVLDLFSNPNLSKCCGLYPLFINNGLVGDFFTTNNPAACDEASDIINGGPCSPSIALSGNGNPINCGSITTQASNGTDLGTTPVNTPISQTFSITNSDLDDLLVIGSMITPTNPAFTIQNLPAFVPTNTTVTFTVTFASITPGAQTSTIQIDNNSMANSPTCDFVVQAGVIPPPIPTMGEWALFLFGLSLLSWFANLIALMQGAQGNGAISLTRVAFYPAAYRKALPRAAGLGLLGLLVIPLIWGTLLPIDLLGVLVSVLLVAYVGHLQGEGRRVKGEGTK